MIGLLGSLAMLVAIPTLGLAASFLVARAAETSTRIAALNLRCELNLLIPGLDDLLASLCPADGFAGVMLRLSLAALGLAGAPMLLFALSAGFCGTSPTRMTQVFPRLVPVVVVAVALNVLVQTALIIFLVAAATLWSTPLLVTVASVAVLITALRVIWATVSGLANPPLLTLGMRIDLEEAPGLRELVDDIASTLGAPLPDHVVLGLSPTFWVTSGRVTALGREDCNLEGRTLYLSAPLLRVLDRDEVTAIIGHEFGHFRGKDTEYSARFVPVYGVLFGAQEGLDRAATSMFSWAWFNRITTLALELPMRALLVVMHRCFERNVSAIARPREFAADDASLEVTAARSAATALVKVSLYSELWDTIYACHINFALAGRQAAHNPVAVFAAAAHLYWDDEAVESASEDPLTHSVEHPFDHHPSNVTRIRRMGIDPESIQANTIGRTRVSGSGPSLIPALDAIEMELDARAMREFSVFATRELEPFASELLDPETLQRIFGALYDLLAPFVRAADDPGARFLLILNHASEDEDLFDHVSFAAACVGLTAVPPVAETVATLDGLLSSEARKRFVTYLALLAPTLRTDDTGPGGPEALSRLIRHFEKPRPDWNPASS